MFWKPSSMEVCIWVVLCSLLIITNQTNASVTSKGKVVNIQLASKALAMNRIGLSPKRNISVYLPPNYESSGKRYPVIYFVPLTKFMMDDKQIPALFDTAIATKKIGEVIIVSGDFSINNWLNFYGNNPNVGYWFDHISDELVNFIDKRYRTISSAKSRGIAGHHLGGHAAFKSAMLYPNIFSSLYAMHPVGTDFGEKNPLYVPNWQNIHQAKSIDELTGSDKAFAAMAQAHLPNISRPPLFADFMMNSVNGELKPHPANIAKLWKSFHIAEVLSDNIDNLQHITAIKFDWGRNDNVRSHVYGNQKLSFLLDTYGIDHEAIEHNGDGYNYPYDQKGHFYNHLLPFFNEHLSFVEQH